MLPSTVCAEDVRGRCLRAGLCADDISSDTKAADISADISADTSAETSADNSAD